MTWRDQAQCLDTDVDMHPSTTDYTDAEWRRAKAVCRGCPVAAACLEHAMTVERGAARHGVWGATDPDQRKSIARRRSRAPEPPRPPLDPGDRRHGTVSGYVRHRCRCGPCVDAKAAYATERRVLARVGGA